MQETLRRCATDLSPGLALARLNVQEQPELARNLRIQKVPTVLIVYKGQIANFFSGIAPDKTIRKFINTTLSEIYSATVKEFIEEAEEYLESEDIGNASRCFSHILSNKAFCSEAIALSGLAMCAVREGNNRVATELIENVKINYEDMLSHPKVKQYISGVELKLQQNTSHVNVEELKARIELDPKDLEAIYELGVFYAQQGKYEESFEQMFKIIKIDRDWKDQAAKEFLLKTIGSLGDCDVALRGKRRLNSIWFN
eukprot:TRINITY_DN5450_c0_g1_i10.p1 TRINITY_DN5450_c0_g1~~TRINITY_DN5450_c0_g1_i10.p1  ORF type:complete len:256 (-),score=38.38 TRINITY_DN5450_c0_g1_i10:205-972(-)